MKQSSSSRRVNEQARQVIAEILMFEVNDPRLDLITITGCEVSFDRTYCNVYYTTTPDRYEKAQAALESAAGRIRTLMGRKLTWRVAPHLRFFLDNSVDNAERIAIALSKERNREERLQKEREEREAQKPSEEEE